MNNQSSINTAALLERHRLRVEHKVLNRQCILKEVAKEFEVHILLILSPSIETKAVAPRQVAHLLSMLIPGYTLEQVGREIGGRDHATVSYSLKTVVGLYDTNPKYRSQLDRIREKLHISNDEFARHLDRWRK